MPDVALEDNWYDNPLLCPVCKSDNLHHESVEVYHRVEDGSNVRVTSVTGDEFSSSIMPEKMSGNPSSRRGGIAVAFWCEQCHGEINGNVPYYYDMFLLQVIQHKGTTFLNWTVPKK
jgi:hypothetical protein